MSSAIPYNDNFQKITESQVSTDPFASEPEIYGENTFVFDENLDILSLADRLALEAKSLLDILQTTQSWKIREKFQIELRKIDTHDNQCSRYKMSLRIDPPTWFKYHVLNNGDLQNLEQLYDFGCYYYKKVYNETEHSYDINNEHEIKRLEFNSSLTEWCYTDMKGKICENKNRSYHPCRKEHYEWCPNENYQTGKCKDSQCVVNNSSRCHFSDFKQNKIIVYQCRYEHVNLKGTKVPCLFHADPNFRIYTDEIEKTSNYPYFIVSARPDATPVITLYPIKHCTNEEYVQVSSAWQAVLKTLIYMKNKLNLDKLPLNHIFINFGKWMSQKAQDPMCRNCHAHINIVLSRETIKKINEINQTTNKNNWIFPSLVGSILPQVCYRFEDAWELMKYMNNYMIPKWFERNREFERKLHSLEIELKLIKQTDEDFKRMKFNLIDNEKEEVEESTNITVESDMGKGINDAIIIPEYQQYNSSKWDRYLFPWNRF